MTQLYDQIDAIFHPRNIAFIGIKIGDPAHTRFTRTFLSAEQAFKFKGGLYLVNPRGGELDGHKVYTSLADIPGEVDYAIGTVSAKIAPEIVRQCADKGVRAIHFFSAGFAETGEDSEARLQEELVEMSLRSGVRIIGPNCMGIYCPESRISFEGDFPREAGHIGFISQSGGNTLYTVHEAGWRGLRFSKAVSFGNACDLNESDFLEYLTDDPQTEIIALYLEGVKEGRRFFRLMEQAARKKPVVLLKGGWGKAGARAASTHTASLAGNDIIWDAFCRQMNIMRPRDVQQLIDILVTLTFMPGLKGRNMAVIGGGGGASVLLADEFERHGFRLPPLPEHIKKEFLSFSPVAGNMLENPVDFSNIDNPDSVKRALKLLTDWEEIDFCLSFTRPSQAPSEGFSLFLQGGFNFCNSRGLSSKPLAYVSEDAILPERNNEVYKLREAIINSNIALFYRFSDAAEALKMVIDYNQRKALH